MAINPGEILNNRYRIKSILGQGGMGAVYHAYDENLNVHVAVKENLYIGNEYGKQFQREANILASVRHPNLPHVIDYFVFPNQGQYLIMDYIDGEDLRQRLERIGKLPAAEVILIGAAICNALTYLHSRIPTIIHRDIKPGNIKITPDGNIFLVDFGLAKIILGDQATSTGARAMTPGYSPPEQYGTAPTDVRSDIYSLGATLYATITGAIPEDALARAMGKAKLTPVLTLQPDLSQELAGVIEKALEIEPENRYQTAEQFHDALLEAGNIPPTAKIQLTISPPPAEVEGTSSPSRKPSSSPFKSLTTPRLIHPAWLAGSILLLIGVILFLAFRPEGLLQQNLTGTPPSIITTPSKSVPVRTLQKSPQPVKTPSPTESPTPPVEFTPTTGLRTPVGGGSGEIAFASDSTGIMQIWVVDPDGKNLKQITDLPDGACQPAWSPDGTRLVFISPCISKLVEYPRARIYILDYINSTQPELLPIPSDPAGDFDPAWSPDGNKIAFTSLRNQQQPNIYIFDLTTQTLTNFSEPEKIDRHPAWSPDGRWIAFARGNTYPEIWIVSTGTRKTERYTPPVANLNLWPAWSADSKMIYYSNFQKVGEIPHLYGLRFEDRNISGLEIRIPIVERKPIGPVVKASISPDAQWLAFEGWPNGSNHDIFIMTVNGSNPTQLTDLPSYEFCPAWRP